MGEKKYRLSFDISFDKLSDWHGFPEETITFVQMKNGLAYRFMLCLLAVLLACGSIFAQNRGNTPRSVKSNRSGYLGYRVEKGDTVYYDSIDPVWVFPKGRRSSGRDLHKYYKLIYNFNKVYPYAILAKDLTEQVDRHIAENSLRRGKKEKYISQMQKQLFSAYEKPLKNMTISQGKLLVKLIDREIGKSSYLIIKDYKNKITAGFWQGIAKLFGNDLKSRYDPKGEDKMTEFLVEKWERGEFDALYFSVFWEMPVHPVIESNTIQFDD